MPSSGAGFSISVNVTSRVTLPARRVQVSVAAEDGETDVQALFDLADNTTLAVLVENKIEHSITSDQSTVMSIVAVTDKFKVDGSNVESHCSRQLQRLRSIAW